MPKVIKYLDVQRRLTAVLDEITHVNEHGATPDALGTLCVALQLAHQAASAYRGQLMGQHT